MNSTDGGIININGKKLATSVITGIVADTTTRSETEVTGSGGGGVPNTSPYSDSQSPVSVNIKSTVTRFQNMHVIDRDGKEHALEFVNYLVSCRKSNLVSVIVGGKHSSKNINVLATYNHDTEDVTYNDEFLRSMYWPTITALVLYPVLICLFLIIAALIVFSALEGTTGVTSIALNIFFWPFGLIVGFMIGKSIASFILEAIASKRTRKFINHSEWNAFLQKISSVSKDDYRNIEIN